MASIKQFVKNALTGFFSRLPFKLGSGESTAIFGKQAEATGDFSIASGTSTTSAADRVNLETATNAQIISEWEASDPDTDKFSLAKGEASHVEGNNNLALGDNSHSEGNGCIAGDNSSHAEGTGSKALGKYSHAEGLETISTGSRSHAEGYASAAYNKESHAEGTETAAGIDPDSIIPLPDPDDVNINTGDPVTTRYWSSSISYVNGDQCIYSDHVYTCIKAGKNKKPSGSSSYWRREEGQHSEGRNTRATVRASHAEGWSSQATGVASHAEGTSTVASNEASHAEGGSTTAAGKYSHAEGNSTDANEWASHVEGYNTETGGNYENNTKTPDTDHVDGQMAHAEGNSTIALGNSSHSEGVLTFASGEGSHAEGVSEGPRTEVQRDWMWDIMKSATTESRLYQTLSDNTASELYSTGWRLWKIAIGDSPVLPGSEDSSEWEDVYDQNITITSVYTGTSKWIQLSKKLGIGNKTTFGAIFIESEEEVEIFPTVGALGMGSHVEGISTIAENTGEHAEGKYNVSNTGTIHSVGIGTADNARKNAFEIMQNGDVYINGIGGYDGTTITNATSLQSSIAQKAAVNVVSLSSSDATTDVFVGPYRTNASYVFVLENVGQPITYIGFITDGNEGGNSFDVKGNIPPEIRYDKVVCSNGDMYVRINYHNIPSYSFSTNVTVTNFLGEPTQILGSSSGLNVSSTATGYFTKSYFNSVAVPGVVSQTLNWNASNSSYTTSNVTLGPIPTSFIDLVTTNPKVSFNESTGYFSLNELTDLSYEEMKYIYVNGNYPLHRDYSQYTYGYLGRTIMPVYLDAQGSRPAMFDRCSNLEVVGNVSAMNYNNLIMAGTANNMTCASNCQKLRKWLYPINDNYARVANRYIKFVNCPNLVYINTVAINSDYYLKESPKIPYAEIKRWLDNTANSAQATSATRSVTIYVHPDTMSYLNGTVTPPAELGGTSEQWQALVTQAQTYLINFATS